MENLSPITINNYEDVVAYLGAEECKDPDVSSFPKEDQEYHLNHFRLTKAIKALNKQRNNGEVWKSDLNDSDQEKWWPFFRYGEDTGRGSAFVFLLSLSYYDGTYSAVGSRFHMIDEETSDKSVELFFEMYKIDRIR